MARKANGSSNGKTRQTPKPAQPTKPPAPEGVILSPEQQKRRRARSIAIASVLGFMVILFYVVTIVKLGPGVVLNRPL